MSFAIGLAYLNLNKNISFFILYYFILKIFKNKLF